jgi:hypothetical protein
MRRLNSHRRRAARERRRAPAPAPVAPVAPAMWRSPFTCGRPTLLGTGCLKSVPRAGDSCITHKPPPPAPPPPPSSAASAARASATFPWALIVWAAHERPTARAAKRVDFVLLPYRFFRTYADAVAAADRHGGPVRPTIVNVYRQATPRASPPLPPWLATVKSVSAQNNRGK